MLFSVSHIHNLILVIFCSLSQFNSCSPFLSGHISLSSTSKSHPGCSNKAFLITAQSVFIFSNGNKYEGQTKDGKMHGRGTNTWSNGDKYVGDWVDGSRTGNGIYTWPSGNKYELRCS